MTVKTRPSNVAKPVAPKAVSGKGVPPKPIGAQLGKMTTTAKGLSVRTRLTQRNPNSPVEIELSRGPTRYAVPNAVHGAGTLNFKMNGKAIKIAVKADDSAKEIASKVEKAIEKATNNKVKVDMGRTLAMGFGGSWQTLTVRLAGTPKDKPNPAGAFRPAVNPMPNPAPGPYAPPQDFARFIDEPTSAKDGL